MKSIFLKHFPTAVLAVIAGIALSGCETLIQLQDRDVKDSNILSATHEAARQLIKQSKQRLEDGQLIAASFANIDDLEKSSTFGRMIAQQIASEFSKQGYEVVELLLRGDIYISKGEGEFLLSRNLKNLFAEHDAQAVIVGTYAVGSKKVYVTSKLVHADDSIVLASHNFDLSLGPDLRTLVNRNN